MMQTTEGQKKQQAESLTIREAKLVRNLLDGLNLTQALLGAGYAKTTAMKKAGAVVGKGRIRNAIREALEEEGLTSAALARTIARGLEATKRVSCGSRIVEEPDHGIQHRFLETALRLRGEDGRPQIDSRVEESYEQRVRRLRGLRTPTG